MLARIGRVYRAILYGSNGTLSLGRLLVLFGVAALWHVSPCLALPNRTDGRPGDRIIRCDTHTGFARVSPPSDFSNVTFRQLGPRRSFTSPDFVWSLARPVIVATWQKLWVAARKVLIPTRTSGAVRMRTMTVAPKHSLGVKASPMAVTEEIGVATLEGHVLHVLLVRSGPQVTRVYAQRIVAAMQYVWRLIGYRTIDDHPCHAMSTGPPPIESERAVAARMNTGGPVPAWPQFGEPFGYGSAPIHFGPEAFFDTLTSSHRRVSSWPRDSGGQSRPSATNTRAARRHFTTTEAA